MVKWYNRTLPMFSREFDSPWPHKYKNAGFIPAFLVLVAGESKRLPAISYEIATTCTETVSFDSPSHMQF